MSSILISAPSRYIRSFSTASRCIRSTSRCNRSTSGCNCSTSLSALVAPPTYIHNTPYAAPSSCIRSTSPHLQIHSSLPWRSCGVFRWKNVLLKCMIKVKITVAKNISFFLPSLVLSPCHPDWHDYEDKEGWTGLSGIVVLMAWRLVELLLFSSSSSPSSLFISAIVFKLWFFLIFTWVRQISTCLHQNVQYLVHFIKFSNQ